MAGADLECPADRVAHPTRRLSPRAIRSKVRWGPRRVMTCADSRCALSTTSPPGSANSMPPHGNRPTRFARACCRYRSRSGRAREARGDRLRGTRHGRAARGHRTAAPGRLPPRRGPRRRRQDGRSPDRTREARAGGFAQPRHHAFEQWAAERADPKLAAKQLAAWQDDLFARVGSATKGTTFDRLPAELRAAFHTGQQQARASTPAVEWLALSPEVSNT